MQNRYLEMSVTPDKKIRAEIQKVPLSKLKLDPNNVRFRHHPVKSLSDSEIAALIWKEPDTKDLYREINTSRGLMEAPIVNSDYVVMEGNRRIVCLKKLSEKAHGEEQPGIPADFWDTVECNVLPEETPPKDIALMLGRFHVSGKKEWRALNQAAHVSELYNKHGISYDDIHGYLSMSKPTIVRMITAFDATTEYGKKFSSDKEWVGKFSYFYEMYKKPDLANWLEKNGNNDKFMSWLGTGKLTRGAEVRELPQIITVPEALSALDSNGFDAAKKVLSKSDPSVDSKFYGQVKDMIEKLNGLPRDELIEAGTDQARIQSLQRLRETVDSVLKDISALKK
ncbi:MAG TPA: hypothetical protein VFE98_02685 [Candidatus Bathyarchaeia archaeon]|nr:hypothetical protein [Candidatus Bathyarchaeia archaeon]